MSYVLILITVFSTSAGVHSQTRFQAFASREACESAARAIEDGIREMRGTVGREVVAQCHPAR